MLDAAGVSDVCALTPRVNKRHEVLRKDMTNRLRKVCCELSEEAFDQLIGKMVKVKIRHEQTS
jgi:hypothetical protein